MQCIVKCLSYATHPKNENGGDVITNILDYNLSIQIAEWGLLTITQHCLRPWFGIERVAKVERELNSVNRCVNDKFTAYCCCHAKTVICNIILSEGFKLQLQANFIED